MPVPVLGGNESPLLTVTGCTERRLHHRECFFVSGQANAVEAVERSGAVLQKAPPCRCEIDAHAGVNGLSRLARHGCLQLQGGARRGEAVHLPLARAWHQQGGEMADPQARHFHPDVQLSGESGARMLCCSATNARQCFFIKYLDQTNISNAYVSGMKEELGLCEHSRTHRKKKRAERK